MADVLGTNIALPSVSGLNLNILLYILIAFVVVIVLAVVIVMIFRAKTYKYRIEIYENIAGKGWIKSFIDRARVVKIGDGGEEILYLAKKKVYRSAYGRKMGKNTYWFAIGQDGYWYNIVLGDLDAKMGLLDIEPIDRDMRYMHVAIRKNIQERYRKQNFFEKYGTIVMGSIFLIIMIIGIWLLLNKISGISTGIASSVQTAQQLMDANRQIVSSLQNICSTSGVVPTG